MNLAFMGAILSACENLEVYCQLLTNGFVPTKDVGRINHITQVE